MIARSAARRRITAAVLLALIFGWMLEATWGPGPCEPSDLRPAVRSR